MPRHPAVLLTAFLAALAFAGAPPVAAASNPQQPSPHAQAKGRGLVPRAAHGQKAAGQALPAGTNAYCSGCRPPLLFTRGQSVMGGLTGTPGRVTVTPVYWAPPGYSFTSSYKAVINGYIRDVAGASGQVGNVYSVATQYYQQAGTSGAPVQHIQYAITAGAEVDDGAPFPAQSSTNGCVANSGFSACVDDTSLESELQAHISSLGLPIDDAHLYVVMFPSGVETCLGTGVASSTNECSTNVYCAYHSSNGSAPYLVYANEPYPDLAHCVDPTNGAQAPNGDSEADAQVSLISHEVNEAITDWSSAWMDSATYEDGDQCAYVYGAALGSTGGANTLYNQVIGSGRYYTQDEFSNEDYALQRGDPQSAGGSVVYGCLQQDELPAAAFVAPANPVAGTSASFDASGSADPDSANPLAYSWSWGDGTTSTGGPSASHAFFKSGALTVTLTVTDGDGWSSSTSRALQVLAGPPAVQSVSPASAPLGGGAATTITGISFTAASAVSFGGTPAASFTVLSDTQIAAVAPAHASGAVDVAVTTPAGTSVASAGDRFSYAVVRTSGGGVLLSAPAAGAGAAGTDVFVEGTDRGLWHTTWNGGAFASWAPGGGVLTSDPAAVTLGPGNVKVFVRGTDNGLWMTTWNGTAFNGWKSLGGVLTAAPNADFETGTPGRIDVFVRGTDSGLWENSSTDGGATWTGWSSQGGVLTSRAAAVSSSPGHIDVAVRGTDNGLWTKSWSSSTGWSGWRSLGGIATSGPSLASCAAGHLDLFVQGTDGGYWQMGFNGSAWSGWQSAGFNWTSDPTAVCRPGTNVVDVFGRGTDSALYDINLLGS